MRWSCCLQFTVDEVHVVEVYEANIFRVIILVITL